MKKFKDFLLKEDDAPTNTSGNGFIAGVGVEANPLSGNKDSNFANPGGNKWIMNKKNY